MHVWAGAVVVTSILSPQATPALAFTPGAGQPRKNVSALGAQGHGERSLSAHGRRSILRTCAAASLAFVGGGQRPQMVFALVKGNAPPSKISPTGNAEKKCRNVEECQEQAEILASQRDNEARSNAVPTKISPGGSRYLDLVEGQEDAKAAAMGDVVELRYKVLKLGKRSYDGLSGEGTVVFSRGEYRICRSALFVMSPPPSLSVSVSVYSYCILFAHYPFSLPPTDFMARPGYGLEDDEKRPGDSSFVTTLGSPDLIGAISDGVPGMAVGSVRRITVLPQMGWRLPGRDCDGGPGGSGNGGELKTDYVIVPTATLVNEEACFDKAKLPFPTRYDQQRRLAQRFDQSLIVEVELVGFK